MRLIPVSYTHLDVYKRQDTNGLPVSDGFIEPIEYEIVKQR